MRGKGIAFKSPLTARVSCLGPLTLEISGILWVFANVVPHAAIQLGCMVQQGHDLGAKGPFHRILWTGGEPVDSWVALGGNA